MDKIKKVEGTFSYEGDFPSIENVQRIFKIPKTAKLMNFSIQRIDDNKFKALVWYIVID